MAAQAPAPERCHVGLGPGLVDEDEALGIDRRLPPLPASAMARDIRPILLAGEHGSVREPDGRLREMGRARLTVVYDGTDYWCWDGFHRCRAAQLLGWSEIDAHVTQGTLADAQWLSAGANKRHGLPRSIADKARAVRTALTHPNGAEMSDGAIADHVGVSQPFVGKIRKQLAATHNAFESTVRKGRDGRTINTARIGEAQRRKFPRPRSAAEYADARRAGLKVRRPDSLIKLELPNNNVTNCAYDLLQYFTFKYLQKVFVEIVRLNQERQEKEHD